MAFRKKRQDPFQEIQSCLQKRDYKGAVDWFNALLQKDPKNTQIRLRFADTLVLSGKKSDAVKQYRIVADELAEKGFMIRAIAINKKILQLDPKQTDVNEKLAAMNEERSSSTKRPALAEVLYRPGDPVRRATPAAPAAAAPEPKAAPPSTAPPTPAPLPELSLEESMAMEFGSGGELGTSAEAPIPVPPPSELSSGGFEIVMEPEEAEEPEPEALSDEPPSFAEEPIEITTSPAMEEEEIEVAVAPAESGTDSEPEVVLSLDGIESPPASDSVEIVLDAEEAGVEVPAEDAFEISSAGTEEPEVEVIALDAGTEAELAPEEAESLLGALGEDIDSLIDSIIDDVGSSARGVEKKAEPPPTHIPLFSDLTTSEFIAVAILLVRRVAKAGEQIVREGDPGDSMFIVSTGEVRASILKNGQQIPVATMRDGDFFGEMAVLTGEPRTATVTAVKATELLELSRENLREVCSRHPHVEAKIRLAYDERVSR